LKNEIAISAVEIVMQVTATQASSLYGDLHFARLGDWCRSFFESKIFGAMKDERLDCVWCHLDCIAEYITLRLFTAKLGLDIFLDLRGVSWTKLQGESRVEDI